MLPGAHACTHLDSVLSWMHDNFPFCSVEHLLDRILLRSKEESMNPTYTLSSPEQVKRGKTWVRGVPDKKKLWRGRRFFSVVLRIQVVILEVWCQIFIFLFLDSNKKIFHCKKF